MQMTGQGVNVNTESTGMVAFLSFGCMSDPPILLLISKIHEAFYHVVLVKCGKVFGGVYARLRHELRYK